MMKKKMYKSTYGLWQVTTEGDVEGKSTTQLGTHKGHVDEIALYLADLCYYSLKFKLVKPVDNYQPSRKEVNVQFDIESNTWNLPNNMLAEKMSSFFEDRPIHIEPANYFATFKITTEKNIRAEDKKRALDKLNDYERQLLGLE
jgi:hypothetical protein